MLTGGAESDEVGVGRVGCGSDGTEVKGWVGPPLTGGVRPPVEGLKRTDRFCGAEPSAPSSLPSE